MRGTAGAHTAGAHRGVCLSAGTWLAADLNLDLEAADPPGAVRPC